MMPIIKTAEIIIKIDSILNPDTFDLIRGIIDIIEDKNKLAELKKKAVENSEKFSLENLQKYFKKEILDKIDDL